MSGLLRRIRRSRPAEAGEPLPEGQAAAPEEAPTAAEHAAATPAPEPTAQAVPPTPQAPEAAAPTVPPAPQAPQAAAPTVPPTPPAPEAAAPTVPPTPPAPEAAAPTVPPTPPALAATGPAPVLLADPTVPAGLDPAEAPLRPPAGRRGRLRRRLRYLRRAREVMLRDLGGLLFEVHRTGGGDVEAHATVVGAKVQRIVQVDAEAHALEAALAAPRSEAIVFQPGIGGTCATCGEWYGSGARFCSNCGVPTVDGLTAPVPRVAVPPMPGAPRAEAATSELGETGAGAEPADPAEQPAADQPAPDDPAAGSAAPGADEPRRNGRAAEGRTPSGLSSGDPLATGEGRP